MQFPLLISSSQAVQPGAGLGLWCQAYYTQLLDQEGCSCLAALVLRARGTFFLYKAQKGVARCVSL